VHSVNNGASLNIQILNFHFSNCLAHVINLATQALIQGYSKAKHYTKPNEHLPDTEALIRDEVGLIQAIAVKVSTLFDAHWV
jgi:hypothetical protein